MKLTPKPRYLRHPKEFLEGFQAYFEKVFRLCHQKWRGNNIFWEDRVFVRWEGVIKDAIEGDCGGFKTDIMLG